MDDREPVGIDRPIRALGNEVIRDGEEAGRQEEADGVVAVPPLHHRVLHARPHDVGLRREQRDRDGRVVAEMQHGDRQDEGEIEPVGDVDMRLRAPRQRADEHQKIDDPDNRQPQVGVPLRLGVFLALGDAEQIARAGNDDEEIAAEHDEPGRQIAGETRAGRALHDIEGRCDQHVAAEGEDDGRGVQRADAAEGKPGRSKFRTGNASSSAAHRPTVKPAMPQNTAAIVANLTGSIL